jgi:hypothetical protein
MWRATYSISYHTVLEWRPVVPLAETIPKKVVVRWLAQANNWVLAGTDPELDTTNTENDLQMNKEAEERKLQ